ncbi:hypothetical protein ACJ72_06886, partial [Emergomyces africanus]
DPVLVESDTDKTNTEYENTLQWSFTDPIKDNVEDADDNTLEMSGAQFKRQKVWSQESASYS